MATYIIRAIRPDPVLDEASWTQLHPDMQYNPAPTAHVDVIIDSTFHELCGMDITSVDTLKAGIEAYIAAQQQPPAEPPTPADVAALIGQPVTV